MRSDHRVALADEIDRFQSDVRRLALDAVRALIKLELDRRSAKSPLAKLPAKSLPAKSLPAKSLPAKSLPAKSPPAKSPPAKSPPAKSPPAKSPPARSAVTARPRVATPPRRAAPPPPPPPAPAPLEEASAPPAPATVPTDAASATAAASPTDAASPPAPGPAPAAAPTTAPVAAEPATGRKRVPWTREAIIHELATWMLSGTSIDATFVSRHGPPGLVAATRRVFGRFEAALNVAALHVSKLYPDGPPGR